MTRFIRQIRSRDKGPVTGLRLTAGNLNELLAYTGFGKSVVLIEVFACWAVRHDIPVAFVLPTTPRSSGQSTASNEPWNPPEGSRRAVSCH